MSCFDRAVTFANSSQDVSRDEIRSHKPRLSVDPTSCSSSGSARYRDITGTLYASKCGHVSAVKASARKADPCIIFNRSTDLTTSSQSRCRFFRLFPLFFTFTVRGHSRQDRCFLEKGCCLRRCADFLLLFKRRERGRFRDKGGMTRSQRPVKR